MLWQTGPLKHSTALRCHIVMLMLAVAVWSAAISLSMMSRAMDETAPLLEMRSAPRHGLSRQLSLAAHPVDPAVALVPLIEGGLPNVHRARPDPIVKSVPPSAPHPRKAKNRHYNLYMLTQFRHWWKSSRLLVRISGGMVFFNMEENYKAIAALNLLKNKGPKHAKKFAKRIGQGGFMRPFLKGVQPLTRTIRIVCATWRWVEATKSRRTEVGVTELMAFLGNRLSRYSARYVMDWFVKDVALPALVLMVDLGILEKRAWFSTYILPTLGILRALAPWACSFQGSRAGRALTRHTFNAAGDKWMTSMRINDVNLESDDCCESDEVNSADKNYELVDVAKLLAKTLAASKSSSHDVCCASTVEGMAKHGFHMVGCGSGGYAVYHYIARDMSILVHVTPYGPSIFDELPRYVVLERGDSQDTRGLWSSTWSRFQYGIPVVEGYCYKGAFFSKYHFAVMKKMYDKQMEQYQVACRLLCSSKHNNSSQTVPPTDLMSLKQFLAMGKKPKKVKESKVQEAELENLEKKLTKVIKEKMSQICHHRGAVTREDPESGLKPTTTQHMAPPRIIFYFEGLDCVGKSSTGRLVLSALEKAGYEVSLRQYNRPATPEQRLKPWMDRFECPYSSDAVPGGLGYQERPGQDSNVSESAYKALVWDRGPAGDFVYGDLAKASDETKKARYEEFLEFDEKCMDENILFCKLLFIADRDSIAKTLGKRLAHSQICKDLRKWLDSSVGRQIDRDGLDEIENHIDPTDFVAFNSYHKNLDAFTEFARNTDCHPQSKLTNPWLVINTSDRHPARVELLTTFSGELDRFADVRSGKQDSLLQKAGIAMGCLSETHSMVTFKRHLNFRARFLILTMFMLVVITLYVSMRVENS